MLRMSVRIRTTVLALALLVASWATAGLAQPTEVLYGTPAVHIGDDTVAGYGQCATAAPVSGNYVLTFNLEAWQTSVFESLYVEYSMVQTGVDVILNGVNVGALTVVGGTFCDFTSWEAPVQQYLIAGTNTIELSPRPASGLDDILFQNLGLNAPCPDFLVPGSDDSLATHIGDTYNPGWLPCDATADPVAELWESTFTVPAACDGLRWLVIESSGMNAYSAVVQLDGHNLGYLCEDVPPREACQFLTSPFPIALAAGEHTLRILPGLTSSGVDDIIVRNIHFSALDPMAPPPLCMPVATDETTWGSIKSRF